MLRIFILLGITFGVHLFHISQCRIDYVKDAKRMDIKLHLFIDDLELALEQNGHSNLFLGKENEALKADSLVTNYIQDNLSIHIDDALTEFIFISKNITKDSKAIWCDFEILGIDEFQKLTIRNEILLDVYGDQKNITKIKGTKGNIKHFMFEKGHEEEIFSY